MDPTSTATGTLFSIPMIVLEIRSVHVSPTRLFLYCPLSSVPMLSVSTMILWTSLPLSSFLTSMSASTFSPFWSKTAMILSYEAASPLAFSYLTPAGNSLAPTAGDLYSYVHLMVPLTVPRLFGSG